MKIFGRNFGSKPITSEVIETSNNYQAYSTPFGVVGKGDLTKPYVNQNFVGNQGYIRFGEDNLYPQLINQMYYTSPLNSALIDLKVNASVGASFEIVDGSVDGKGKVDEYTFLRLNKVKTLLKTITRNYVMHGMVYIKIKMDANNKPASFKLVPSENVRLNGDKSIFFISDDWSNHLKIVPYTEYSPTNTDKEQILVLEIDSPGQLYSLPSYTNAFNWCYLDGEMSFFHKSNIQNSIFPSFALMFPKLPGSKEEKDEIKATLERTKGASNAGKTVVFAANSKDQLPSIEAIPTNSNDQLFLQTDERIDLKISQAHQVDPIIAGIRTSGKLGSGTDIQIAYQIFEKNVILPLRDDVEGLMNELMTIFGVQGEFVINQYQIIDLEIKEVTDEDNKTKTQ